VLINDDKRFSGEDKEIILDISARTLYSRALHHLTNDKDHDADAVTASSTKAKTRKGADEIRGEIYR